jgi:hypothetical protein
VPELETIKFTSFNFVALLFRTAAAIGERQIFPKQTISTAIVFIIDCYRFAVRFAIFTVIGVAVAPEVEELTGVETAVIV